MVPDRHLYPVDLGLLRPVHRVVLLLIGEPRAAVSSRPFAVCAKNLDFEKAAVLRDRLRELKELRIFV
jgi:excinuclease UvrABC nuclease subunit